MGADTKIEWAHHTFNGWHGCAKVHAGCDNCYAEADDKRHTLKGVDRHWGKDTPRRFIIGLWSQVMKWQREAAEADEMRRVFCGSMKDMFERHAGDVVDQQGRVLYIRRDGQGVTVDPAESFEDDPAPVSLDWLRSRIFDLVETTPNLLWLFLTKRPQNIRRMVPTSWLVPGGWPSNVMAGTSPCDQKTADWMIPALLNVPGQRFLSMEPLLGAVDLTVCHRPPSEIDLSLSGQDRVRHYWQNPLSGQRGIVMLDDEVLEAPGDIGNRIAWCIVGGESQHNARPMHPDWARSLRDQCQAAGVPFFFKQWGEWKPISEMSEQETESYYKPNRKADPDKFEDQHLLNDIFGRTCRVETSAIRHDGVVGRDVYQTVNGHGAFMVFRLGKKAAGRELDGRTWDQIPEVQLVS